MCGHFKAFISWFVDSLLSCVVNGVNQRSVYNSEGNVVCAYLLLLNT